MDDEGKTLLILGYRVIGQGELCPPARGCHALRCLVFLQNSPDSLIAGNMLYIFFEFEVFSNPPANKVRGL